MQIKLVVERIEKVIPSHTYSLLSLNHGKK